ncbi:MAG: diaminopimelate epimerase [Planctomycetaceae bacterium]|nr:diaminopimelate epimerase [Planctomycetaceae bacterium]
MHGLGNDYVYIDRFTESALLDPVTLAPLLADRPRGVGGDGLILVEPSNKAAAKMRMFNADGSESEMCGNGVRCVGHIVVSRGYSAAGDLTIETGRGVLGMTVSPVSSKVSQVRVDMGCPLLNPEDIPVDSAAVTEPIINLASSVIGNHSEWWDSSLLDSRMTCVSMGNPHAIFYCGDVEKVPLEMIGPLIENHKCFPHRINVHFVQCKSRDRVKMVTWERGSGPTQACGTGASAVCVAGRLTGRTNAMIKAELPGGELELSWDMKGSVYMSGPAEEVFLGVWQGFVS